MTTHDDVTPDLIVELRTLKHERDALLAQKRTDDEREITYVQTIERLRDALAVCVDVIVHGPTPGNANWWDLAEPALERSKP